MIYAEWSWFMIFLVRGIIQIIMIGILTSELFNHRRKNKFEISWLLLITLLWSLFLGISDYGIFTSGLSIFWSSISTLSLVLALGFFIAIIVRRFKLVNKVLAFPTAILASAMLVVVLVDRYSFSPVIIFPMVFTSFVVTVLGSFVFIDFMIKTSSGYKAKPRKMWEELIK